MTLFVRNRWKVDEVQLLGGGSRFPFIVEFVRSRDRPRNATKLVLIVFTNSVECEDHVVLEGTNCTTVRIIANEKEVPDGARVLLGQHTFENLSDFKHIKPLSGFLVMRVRCGAENDRAKKIELRERMVEIADGEMHKTLARSAKNVEGWKNSVSRNETVLDPTRKTGKGLGAEL
jgi:hypothetical protein